MGDNEESGQESAGFLGNLVNEIIGSPINLALVAIMALLIYKIFKSKTKPEETVQVVRLPKMRRDFRTEELKPYDGTGPDGRILIGVNGSVYDVTRGKAFYGPGGPYNAFAGRDASRCLATFSVVPPKDEYDDLSDLDTEAMNYMKEWDEQIKEKYDYVGKLLKPGEAPTNYSDEEEEGSNQEGQQEEKDVSKDKQKSKDD